jgi:2-keto-3-deoxygluconate permease
MVVPLFIGMIINTFFPMLLQIGGFTQALSGVGYPTVLGMYLFTVGTKSGAEDARARIRPPHGQSRHRHDFRPRRGSPLRR